MSEFATALQEAMDARGYSLGRLAKGATERGAKVSAATLSYWITGQSKPRRKSSLEVVAAIEEILELDQGSLMGLAGVTDTEWRMDRPRARRIVPNHPDVDRIIRRWGLPDNDGLDREAFVCRLEWIGDDITFRYTLVSRAMRDGADRFIFAANKVGPDDGYELGDIAVTRGARLGRVSDDIPGLQVLEVVLPEPLDEGEAFVAELVRKGHATPGAFTDFQVNTVRPIRVLSVQTVFDEAACPARMRRSTTRLGRDGSEDVFEADTPLVRGMAQSTLSNIDMGRVRLDWS